MKIVDSDQSRTWRTSSRCDTSACVEVATAGGGVWLRDSTGAELVFSVDAWCAFLARVRRSRRAA
jgi:Domain of unknown function (DUF397)